VVGLLLSSQTVRPVLSFDLPLQSEIIGAVLHHLGVHGVTWNGKTPAVFRIIRVSPSGAPQIVGQKAALLIYVHGSSALVGKTLQISAPGSFEAEFAAACGSAKLRLTPALPPDQILSAFVLDEKKLLLITEPFFDLHVFHKGERERCPFTSGAHTHNPGSFLLLWRNMVFFSGILPF
jgi:hypothetical protein